MKKSKLHKIVFGSLIAFSFLVVSAMIFLTQLAAIRNTPPPVIGQVPDFSLTERSGQTVRLGDLRGKVWIVDFVFTRCAGPCSLMTHQMAELQKRIGEARDVRLVTITVDPERDTPEVLREYADMYGASKTNWFFLTGDKEKIFTLIRKGFMLIVDEDDKETLESGGHAILHSTKFVVVDTQGRIRGTFDGTNVEEMNNLLGLVENLRPKRRR
jgi:cytochrome oxidase Cu insertion factor (SCO1/SenC/PrrC family)